MGVSKPPVLLMDTFSPYSVEMLLCCSSAKSKSKKLTLGFFAYQDFITCSLESRDITLCSSCVAVQGVKVIWRGRGSVENPDTSLVRRLKHFSQK